MNTCTQASPTSLPAGAPVAPSSYFTRLQRLAGRARFVSVDLVDNFVMSMPPNRDTGIVPPADQSEPGRLMPWRLP